ncbi:carbamoyl-phosphate synthase subunit L [Pseudomonas tructae]|uniref:Carbamoyl-phosphate synthase subunit L n=1 Tax=Pseudomonas tructae TaxID=2518644 RepID=A0A411MCZ8_9PSED|nr:ATP-grasp domain-containing protein [Pseudomonas tructae]QBF24579.1 carbamoyl-phosphate synthase subunit L [Pseudomonas tructae]
MKRILVSGASGIVGYGILRALRQARPDCLLVGTTIYDDSVAPAFCDVFEQAPPTSAPEYLDWLLDTLRRQHIDMLIPGIEADMYHWVEHIPQISSTGALPLLNDPALIGLCKDKWGFYQQLLAAGVACAIDSSLEQDYATLVARFGLPFLLKPRRGFGSKGIVRVSCEAQFQQYRTDIGPVLMAQPIVGNDDEEFTTSAFCDGRGGSFASMTLRRKLSRDGFTDKAEVVDSAQFIPAIDELCRLFRPLGPTNFQFRGCAQGPKLLEINPRISSSTSIRSAFGYNESAMALDYFLDQRDPVQPAIRRGRAVRYTDEQIFYEDGVHL